MQHWFLISSIYILHIYTFTFSYLFFFFAPRKSWASLLLIFEFKYVHTASSYNIIHEIFEWHKHLQNPTRDKIIIYQKKFYKRIKFPSVFWLLLFAFMTLFTLSHFSIKYFPSLEFNQNKKQEHIYQYHRRKICPNNVLKVSTIF